MRGLLDDAQKKGFSSATILYEGDCMNLKRGLFHFDTKQLAFSSLMGVLALLSNNSGLQIPILPPLGLNPRWIFSLFGACWCGPIGGLLAGILCVIDPKIGIDIVSGPATHFLVGLLGRVLSRKGHLRIWAVILMPAIGIPVDTLISNFLFGIPVYVALPVVSFISIMSIVITIAIGIAVEKRLKFLLASFE